MILRIFTHQIYGRNEVEYKFKISIEISLNMLYYINITSYSFENYMMKFY